MFLFLLGAFIAYWVLPGNAYGQAPSVHEYGTLSGNPEQTGQLERDY
jgi:hypothetical protein